MPLDAEVESAIYTATKSLCQDEKVAKRLVSWLKDASERELSINEKFQHLDSLKGAIFVDAEASQ